MCVLLGGISGKKRQNSMCHAVIQVIQADQRSDATPLSFSLLDATQKRMKKLRHRVTVFSGPQSQIVFCGVLW